MQRKRPLGQSQKSGPGGTGSTAAYTYPKTRATPSGQRRHILNAISGAETNVYGYDPIGSTLSESVARGTFNLATGSLGDSAYTQSLCYTFDAKNRLSRVYIGDRQGDDQYRRGANAQSAAKRASVASRNEVSQT